MSEDFSLLAGQLSTWPSKDELATVLRGAGLRIYIGRYSIRVEDCERISFEEYGGDLSEPCIVASAQTTERMVQDAELVSHVLAGAGIRHRFEVYDGEENLAAYLHHDWPTEAKPQS
jgi:hypothetical protein